MFKDLLKGILSAIAIKMLDNYRHLTIQLLKIEAAKSYLHGVKMARLSAIGLMGMGLMMSLICLGVVLVHVGLFVLLPWSVEAKAILGIILGLVYVAVGVFVLHAAMDERAWMKKSGAAEMMSDAINSAKRPSS
jgi:hypothetical protein